MCLAFPLGEGGAGLRLGRCTVTDEVRPLKAGVTAAVSTAAIERVLGSLTQGSRGGAARRERSQYAATRIIYKNVARPAPHVFSTPRIAAVEKMQSDESEYEESKK